jgi:phage FluMu protein Com
MTIEFRCQSCDKLLRTPDGTQGKQAKCPQCGSLMQIPAESTYAPPRDPQFAATASYAPGGNPYQTPGADSFPPAAPPSFQPTRIVFSDVLEQTWDIFKSNVLMCVVGALVAHLCMDVLITLVGGLMGALADNSPFVIAATVSIAGAAGIAAITSFFLLGMAKYFLGIARAGQANFADLFSVGPLLLHATALYTLLFLGTVSGLVFLIVPGVLFLLFFCQAPFMFLDQRTGVVDSFRYSATAMAGNKGTVFLLFAVLYFAGAVFTVLTCGLGSFFVTPFIMLAFAVTYLGVTGQPTSARRAVPAAAERPFYNPGVQPQR